MWRHLHFFAFAKETIDVNPHFCPVSADMFLKAFAVFSELLNVQYQSIFKVCDMRNIFANIIKVSHIGQEIRN